MARVTVEDCLLKVPNKFELVLLASKRAKDIESGATPSIPKDNDKPSIIALREIAEDVISIDGLRKVSKKSIVEDVNTVHTFEEKEKDIVAEEIIDDRKPVSSEDFEAGRAGDYTENSEEGDEG
jgi:DNA-directed RNA polymerase subunit omega